MMIKERTIIENTRKEREASGEVFDNGGLKEWERIEMEMQQFGDIQRDYGIDEEVNFPDFSEEPKDPDEANESREVAPKRENLDKDSKPRADTTPGSGSMGFTAVNNTAVKSEAENVEPGRSNALEHPFGSQGASHNAEINTTPTVSGYHTYGYHYPTPGYGPIAAESAQRVSLSMHQHASNQGPSVSPGAHLNHYPPYIPESACDMSWQMGGELSVFAGGMGGDKLAELASHWWGGQPLYPSEARAQEAKMQENTGFVVGEYR